MSLLGRISRLRSGALLSADPFNFSLSMPSNPAPTPKIPTRADPLEGLKEEKKAEDILDPAAFKDILKGGEAQPAQPAQPVAEAITGGLKGLSDKIAQAEVGTADATGYDTVYGHAKTPTPLTTWTVDDTLSYQQGRGTFPVGRYQIVRSTLEDLKDELGLEGTEVMTPELQDRLFLALAKRRGYEDYASGRMNKDAFIQSLSQEWAALPKYPNGRGHYSQHPVARVSYNELAGVI